MIERIPSYEQEPQYSEAEILDGRRISRAALNKILEAAGIESPKSESGLIESVPGVERTVAKTEQNNIFERRVIEGVDFKGDPSRVIGHPSNPTTEITQAHAEQNDNSV